MIDHMNYVIWAAVSTDEQAADDKFSLDNQVELSRRHAQAKGWREAADPYIVPGESRTKYVNLSDAERAIPQLKQLLDDAQAGKFNVVVCYEYDRFRELLDPVARTLAFFGVQLYSVNQPIEPQSPSSFTPYSNDSEFILRGMNQIISRAAIANLRRKYFSEMPKRVQVKGLHSGALPWAYKKPAGRETDPNVVPVLDADLVPHLLMMKNMLLAGRSTYQIVAELERLGVPPPKTYLRKSDRTNWDATTVRRILTNPYYAGFVRWGVTKTQTNLREGKISRINRPAEQVIIAKGVHEPVWDDATLYAIQAEIDRRAPSHRGHTTRQLTGLLQCSICGATLWRHAGGSKKIKSLRRVTWRCSVGFASHMVHPDDEMLDKVAEGLADALNAQQAEEPGHQAALAELDELEGKRRRVGDAFEAGLFDLVEFSRRVESIDTRIAELKRSAESISKQQLDYAARSKAISDLRELIKQVDLREYLRSADYQATNTLLRQVVEKIVVFPDGAVKIIPK